MGAGGAASGVQAEDAAPAAGQADHGAGVVVGDLVGGLPGVLQPFEGTGADRLPDLGSDISGLGVLQMPASRRARTRAAATPRPRGEYPGPGPGGGEVAEDELADGGAQPAADPRGGG